MKYLFWLDMEMSGLDHLKERILEVAVVVTDTNFNVIKDYQAVVYQENSVLENMNDWCKETHGKTGLTAKVSEGKAEDVVEKELIEFFKEFFDGEKAVIAGNSISQDRKFIDHWMPNLANLLHYRMLDVSSFKIVFESMFNKKCEKKHKHRAVEDIYESIEELKFYLKYVEI